jgi:arsenite methyltransferase
MDYLNEIDITSARCDEFYDELPLWSAPFGMLLLDRVPLRRGITVLDIGAGTGFLTVELAQRCGPDATVIAVDPWRAAVERLRKKVAFLGLSNVRVIESDAATLDLPEASADLIVSNLGINNFENPQAVLQECARVAKPGARLFLTTNLVGHMQEFYDVCQATLLELEHRDRLAALDEHIRHRATIDSVTTMLGGAGFRVRDIHTDSFRMRFADGSTLLRHFFIRLGFLPAWRSLVPASAAPKFFATLERNLNNVAANRGELSLTIPIACVDAEKTSAVASQ